MGEGVQCLKLTTLITLSLAIQFDSAAILSEIERRFRTESKVLYNNATKLVKHADANHECCTIKTVWSLTGCETG